jgi:hypothetical protein
MPRAKASHCLRRISQGEPRAPLPLRHSECADLSAEIFHVQAAAFDDAFQRADGNGFVAVHGHNHLSAIRMTPFLMAAGLSYQHKAVLA